jgi:hypothetical protein
MLPAGDAARPLSGRVVCLDGQEAVRGPGGSAVQYAGGMLIRYLMCAALLGAQIQGASFHRSRSTRSNASSFSKRGAPR